MKPLNILVYLCTSCNLANICCTWYCCLTPCALGIQQLNKSSPIRCILLILLFFFTPLLNIVGLFHCILGIMPFLNASKEFLDTGDLEEGFKKCAIPEKHNMIIDKTNGCIDNIFSC